MSRKASLMGITTRAVVGTVKETRLGVLSATSGPGLAAKNTAIVPVAKNNSLSITRAHEGRGLDVY